MYEHKNICEILESIISYKTNIRYYRYLEAYQYFLYFFDILKIDFFDLNMYYSTGYTATHNYMINEDEIGHTPRKVLMKNPNENNDLNP
jgi:hypothetical protein